MELRGERQTLRTTSTILKKKLTNPQNFANELDAPKQTARSHSFLKEKNQKKLDTIFEVKNRSKLDNRIQDMDQYTKHRF